jgi:hypothetical protein
MVYRIPDHFSLAHQTGQATDAFKYFATPHFQDLGVVKQQRKPKIS